jgi:peptidoglycan/xylan/chitin deacetylase (PgdA/CDA1 family)
MKKFKAITFSYDDGVTQDKRLIDIFDKYGLKATFNLNSALLGKEGSLVREGYNVNHTKNNPEDVREIYKNHEIAVHTLHHPLLPSLSEEEIIKEVEEDRLRLSELAGYEVVGMAYPCGGVNNDDRVAGIIKENTGVKYSRTITSSHSFDLQDNLYRFNPTVYHHVEMDLAFRMAEEFINLKTDTPKIFYIWGHSYEFDIYRNWDRMEELCKLLSGHDDIFYGTNKEVLLNTDWH